MTKKDKKGGKGSVEVPASASSSAPATAAPPAAFDSELDALFFSGRGAGAPATSSKATEIGSDQKMSKSQKHVAEAKGASSSDGSEADEDGDEEEEEEDAEEEEEDVNMSDIEREMEEQGFDGGDSSGGEKAEGSADEESEGDESDEGGSDSEDSDAEDGQPPRHETLSGTAGSKRLQRKLQEREEEPKQIRDKRSLFIGNVPLSCVSSKSLTKALTKHVAALSPYPSVTRIDSIRYRSVPFSHATSDYMAESGADAAANEKRRARARAFRDAVDAAEAGDSNKGPANPYLNSKQKRKVAYINQEISEKAKSVNAYITLDKLSDADFEKLEKLPESSLAHARRVTPQILAALTAAKADETLFEGRHLRVDLATSLSLEELVSAGLDSVLSSTSAGLDKLARILSGSSSGGGGKGRREDQSKTLFIGNLDFEADDEDLRAMLEGLLRQERGEPPLSTPSETPASLPQYESTDQDGQQAADGIVRATWVQSVRIVRDAATQMGKGFAYVLFLDEICVDELMAIWESDEAFLSAAKGGGTGARGRQVAGSRGDGRTQSGGRVDFARKIKLNKRALRLARCKGSSGSGGKRSQGDRSNGPSSSVTATPQRPTASSAPGTNAKDAKRRRSMGAPTPGGSSPSAANKKRRLADGSRGGLDSPSRPTAASSSSSSKKDNGIVANPAPLRQRSEAEMARLQLKRNDPERQAKRMAKKDKKRADFKRAADVSGDAAAGKREKVDLSKAVKKNSRDAKSKPKARGAAGKGR